MTLSNDYLSSVAKKCSKQGMNEDDTQNLLRVLDGKEPFIVGEIEEIEELKDEQSEDKSNKPTQRELIKEELKKRGIKYKGNPSTENLKLLLTK